MKYKIELKITRVRVYLSMLMIILAGGLYYSIEINHTILVRQKALTQELEAIRGINQILINRVNGEIRIVDMLLILEGTPMEEAIPYIKEASQYWDIPVEVFIGIANAESSFKYFKCFNPWGIGNNGPRCYQSWEHSANGFGQLVRYYYFNKGLDTPEKMLSKYVGWESSNWVKNVKEYWRS